jgi:hypothetical protein
MRNNSLVARSNENVEKEHSLGNNIIPFKAKYCRKRELIEYLMQELKLSRYQILEEINDT